MEVISTIRSIERVGTSEWFRVQTEEGLRFDTKIGEIAAKAQALLGQRAVIGYTERLSNKLNERTGQPYINRYLEDVAPTNGSAPTSTLPLTTTYTNTAGTSAAILPATGPAVVTTTTADERGVRMGRNNIAAASAPTLLQMSDGAPETIQKILDGLARWSETGEPIFS